MIKRFANGDRNGKYTSGMAAFPFFACISRGKTKDLGNELVFNLLTLETKPSKHHSPPFTSFSSLSLLCVAPTHSINDRLKICIVCIAEKITEKAKERKKKKKIETERERKITATEMFRPPDLSGPTRA